MKLTSDTIGALSLLAGQGTPIGIVKLINLVESLPCEQKAEPMAFLWTGRDGSNFVDNLSHARNVVDDSVGYYMAEQGTALTGFLRRGMDLINGK